jgi:hypothetical protein
MTSEPQKGHNMAEFGLVESFDVDSGELDGLSPQMCFSLGVEWEIFRQRLKSGKPFTEIYMSPNGDRLAKLAERAGRFVEARPASDGWTKITVGGYRV